MIRFVTTTLAVTAAAPALAHPGSHAGETPAGMMAHLLSQADHLAPILVLAGVVALAVVLAGRWRRG